MSDLIETNVPARRRLSDRPERQVHREQDDGPAVTIESSGSLSPAEALADSQRQLQSRDRELSAERAARAEAERARQAAEQQASAQAQARSSDRLTAVNADLEAAKAASQALRATIKSAREAGDFDAEMEAQEQLGQANFRVASASAELETLKQQQPAQRQQQAPQQQPQFTPAVRQWMDDHPRYTAGAQPSGSKEDREYYAVAMAGHHAAQAAGYPLGSTAYFDEINRRVAEFEASEGGEPPPPRQEQRNMRDDTAPPSRGAANGPGAGWKTAKVNLGQNGSVALIDYRRDRTGGQTIRFRNPADRENFEDGAKTCYPSLYEQNPAKALADYMLDQISSHEEGWTDLKIGDGQIFRSDER